MGVVRMPPSTLNVHWPLQLHAGNTEYVLYLVKEPEVRYYQRHVKLNTTC